MVFSHRPEGCFVVLGCFEGSKAVLGKLGKLTMNSWRMRRDSFPIVYTNTYFSFTF